MIPSVFLSHGAPTLPLEESETRRFLEGLGERLGRPRAVPCVSAHWEEPAPCVSSASRPATVHDFHGFPEASTPCATPRRERRTWRTARPG